MNLGMPTSGVKRTASALDSDDSDEDYQQPKESSSSDCDSDSVSEGLEDGEEYEAPESEPSDVLEPESSDSDGTESDAEQSETDVTRAPF